MKLFVISSIIYLGIVGIFIFGALSESACSTCLGIGGGIIIFLCTIIYGIIVLASGVKGIKYIIDKKYNTSIKK